MHLKIYSYKCVFFFYKIKATNKTNKKKKKRRKGKERKIQNKIANENIYNLRHFRIK